MKGLKTSYSLALAATFLSTVGVSIAFNSWSLSSNFKKEPSSASYFSIIPERLGHSAAGGMASMDLDYTFHEATSREFRSPSGVYKNKYSHRDRDRHSARLVPQDRVKQSIHKDFSGSIFCNDGV
jgi:hypothetical protein